MRTLTEVKDKLFLGPSSPELPKNEWRRREWLYETLLDMQAIATHVLSCPPNLEGKNSHGHFEWEFPDYYRSGGVLDVDKLLRHSLLFANRLVVDNTRLGGEVMPAVFQVALASENRERVHIVTAQPKKIERIVNFRYQTPALDLRFAHPSVGTDFSARILFDSNGDEWLDGFAGLENGLANCTSERFPTDTSRGIKQKSAINLFILGRQMFIGAEGVPINPLDSFLLSYIGCDDKEAWSIPSDFDMS